MRIFWVFFQALKFLTGRSDLGASEIVESVNWVEIVEFAEFAEIVENCGIVEKLATECSSQHLRVAGRVECAGAFCFSEANKKFHRATFFITCHMLEQN